jgi:hypothetical protein
MTVLAAQREGHSEKVAKVSQSVHVRAVSWNARNPRHRPAA